MQDSNSGVPTLVDHVAKITRLTEEAADADTVARAAHQRRDTAIRAASDQGWSPRKLHRCGVPLAKSTLYRVIGLAEDD